MAGAADVNGDGYSDLLVGAGYYWSDATGERTGQALLYLGSPDGLDETPAWRKAGPPDSYFGGTVAGAGDVNGDGYADLLVGAPDAAVQGQEIAGRVDLYLGAAGGPNATPAQTLGGTAVDAQLGWLLAPAGDLNGDGFSDVFVGSGLPLQEEAAPSGQVYLGGNRPVPMALWAYSDLPMATGGTLSQAVHAAGDLNGDGYTDVVAGAPGHDDGAAGTGAGQVLVFYGTEDGPGTEPDWMAVGPHQDAQFGAAVAVVGDVNGDGYEDLAVAAPGYTDDDGAEGQVAVYHGSAAGLGAEPAWTADGDAQDAMLGWSLAPAGDVNGDGHADLLVGTPYFSGAGFWNGQARLYLGGSGGLGSEPAWMVQGDAGNAQLGASLAPAGDVNGDGYGDVVVGAPGYSRADLEPDQAGAAYLYHGGPTGLAATPAWVQVGENEMDLLGFAVAGAGDLNGDGYADVAVGLPGWGTATGRAVGRVQIFLGSDQGLGADADWTATGSQAEAGFGAALAGAGDLNGDGYGDLAVGAPYWFGLAGEQGQVLVYPGGPGKPAEAPMLRATGSHGRMGFGGAVAGAGDVNGDGYHDLIIAAPGTDTEAPLGQVVVFPGGGTDGVPLGLQQRTAAGDPVAVGGRSDRTTAVDLALQVHSPYGPGRVKLEWEIKPVGSPFDGSGLGRTPGWMELAPARADFVRTLVQTLTDLEPGTAYHWRVRVRYDPAQYPWQPASRWLTPFAQGQTPIHFRTAAPASPPGDGDDGSRRRVSHNADLRQLTVTPGTLEPAFEPGTTAYTVTVGPEVEAVTLVAVPAHWQATLTLNGEPMPARETVSVALPAEETDLAIVVTAGDGVTTRTYQVTVVRSARPPEPGDGTADGEDDVQGPEPAAGEDGADAGDNPPTFDPTRAPDGFTPLGWRTLDGGEGGILPGTSPVCPTAMTVTLTQAEQARIPAGGTAALFRVQADGGLQPVAGFYQNGRIHAAIWQPGEYVIGYVDTSFPDMMGHWAEEAVAQMAARWVVRGDSGGRFRADDTISRAEYAALLVRSLGLPPAAGADPAGASDAAGGGAGENESSGAPGGGTVSRFRDVEAGDWFHTEVMAAARYGLVRGYEDGTFRPDQPVTREEAVAMVLRARARLCRPLVGLMPHEVATILGRFADGAAVSPWAREIVTQAVNEGLLGGDANGQLRPGSATTRAEAAVLMARLWEQ